MSRFIWLVRREIWEHKAIWVAPLIVIGCLVLAALTGNIHLGPIGSSGIDAAMDAIPAEKQARLVLIAYAGLALVVFMVMGIVSFFYALDSLYADRRDRSVLFWKSLPLSDAETVLSKFAVAAIVIPLVALAGAVLSQFVIAVGASAKFAMAGQAAGVMWDPQAVSGGIAIAVVWSVTAMVWYAPVVGYLMLASAWAPKGPFLWAVLPPASLFMLERVLLHTNHVGDFIKERMFGLLRLVRPETVSQADPETGEEVSREVIKLSELDLLGSLRDFYGSAELWLGVVAAAILVAAAMWVRRYRDETA
ncbi:MAG TPA: ABC-2 transporter permease [Steroidobacteraceae bacterium]|nr:ABC-2 transporter permease [Steroidobacteraceae bacterium]